MLNSNVISVIFVIYIQVKQMNDEEFCQSCLKEGTFTFIYETINNI